MHFQIGLALWELQVIRDLFCVRYQTCSVKKKFLKIFQILQKAPVLESLFNTFVGLRTCNVLEKRLQNRWFSSEIWETFKSTYLKSICEPLFLYLLKRRNYNPLKHVSRSHHYAQLGSALQKHFFCLFWFDNGYSKRFHRPIF